MPESAHSEGKCICVWPRHAINKVLLAWLRAPRTQTAYLHF